MTMPTKANDPIDAVFVIGTGSKNNNEELKYALRNLEKHCPFIRNVYISGECPSWADTDVVKHLKWPDRFTHAKDANIVDKLRHACEQPDIAQKILFCSDDQFQTRVCSWDDFKPRWLRQYSETDNWYESRKRLWHTRLHKTLERDRLRRKENGLNTANVFYYQPHIWMPIDRDLFIEYAKWSDYEHRDDTIIASGYFNFIDAGGKSNFDHIFISSGQRWPVQETHVAYSDPSFSSAMEYLKKTFYLPSIYEKEGKKVTKAVSAEKATSIESFVEEDEKSIEQAKAAILSNAVWSSLHPEIEEAENIRKADFTGWRKVWNDIILRWRAATESGKLNVPVSRDKGPDAAYVIERYKEEKLGIKPDKKVPAEVAQETPGKPHCSKCEERRKRREQELREQREKARQAAESKKLPLSTSLGARETAPEPPKPETTLVKEGCLDCAISHLAVAIAYMNSNAGRPDVVDIELAKGEVTVASQQLLALNHYEAYNKCIQMLDSFYSENSMFSVATLQDTLKQAIAKR